MPKPIEQPAISEEQVRVALKYARGSVTVAAASLGVTRQWMYVLMRRYGIEIERVIA